MKLHHSTIKPLVNCLKKINFSGFHNINLTQSKHQPPILKNVYLKQNMKKFHRVRLTVVIRDVNAATIF